MLTKGAIGNLINRYRAVLKKCHLINTFGSLAVATMLVLGGAGAAEAIIVSGAEHITEEDLAKEIAITEWVNGDIVTVTNGNTVTKDYRDTPEVENVAVDFEGKNIIFGGPMAFAEGTSVGDSISFKDQYAHVDETNINVIGNKKGDVVRVQLNAGGTAISPGAVSSVGKSNITISGPIKLAQYQQYEYDEDGHRIATSYTPIRGGGCSVNGGKTYVEESHITINAVEGMRLGVSDIMGGGCVVAGGSAEDGVAPESLGEAYTRNSYITIKNLKDENLVKIEDPHDAPSVRTRIFGGGDMAEVRNAEINIINCSANELHVYGGGYAEEEGRTTITGNTKINIDGYKIEKAHQWNDEVSQKAHAAWQEWKKSINDDQIPDVDNRIWHFAGSVVGGGYSSRLNTDSETMAGTTSVENAEITIKNSTMRASIIGGGFAEYGGKAYVGTTNVTITDNSVIDCNGVSNRADVFGGGWAKAATTHVDTVNLTITGGATVMGQVYGGGHANGYTMDGEGNIIQGSEATANNVTVTLDNGSVTSTQRPPAHERPEDLRAGRLASGVIANGRGASGHVENSTIFFRNSTLEGARFVGGSTANNGATVTHGTSNIYIESGFIGPSYDPTRQKLRSRTFNGGAEAYNGGNSTMDTANMYITGGEIQNSVYGGSTVESDTIDYNDGKAFLPDGEAFSRVENTNVYITGGKFTMTYKDDKGKPITNKNLFLSAGGDVYEAGRNEVGNALLVIDGTSGKLDFDIGKNEKAFRILTGGLADTSKDNFAKAGFKAESHVDNGKVILKNIDIEAGRLYAGGAAFSAVSTVTNSELELDNAKILSIETSMIDKTGQGRDMGEAPVEHSTITLTNGSVISGQNRNGAIEINAGTSVLAVDKTISEKNLKGIDIRANSRTLRLLNDVEKFDFEMLGEGKWDYQGYARNGETAAPNKLTQLDVMGTTKISTNGTKGFTDASIAPNASGHTLKIGGTGEAVGNIALTNNSISIVSGTLAAETISVDDTGRISVDGGSLKTSSDQIFKTPLHDNGKNATDTGGIKESLTGNVVFNSGSLALTDKKYNQDYANSALDTIRSTASGSTATVVMLGRLVGKDNQNITFDKDDNGNHGSLEVKPGNGWGDKNHVHVHKGKLGLVGGEDVDGKRCDLVVLDGNSKDSVKLAVGGTDSTASLTLGNEYHTSRGKLDGNISVNAGSSLNVVKNGDYVVEGLSLAENAEASIAGVLKSTTSLAMKSGSALNVEASGSLTATELSSSGSINIYGKLESTSNLNSEGDIAIDKGGMLKAKGLTSKGRFTVTNGTLNVADASVKNMAIAESGSVRATNFTVMGHSHSDPGLLTVKGKLTVEKDLTLKHADVTILGNVTTKNLDATNSEIHVGGQDEEDGKIKKGTLIVTDSQKLKGSTIFIDPEWSDNPAENIIENASHFAQAGGEVSSSVIAARNSLAVLGDSNTDWAISAFHKSNAAWEREVTAAIAIAAPQVLVSDGTSTGGLLADGSLPSGGSVAAGDATFENKSLLLVKGSAASGGNTALTGSGTLTVADGAKLYISDAKAGVAYNITDGFAEYNIEGWTEEDLLLSYLVKGNLKIEDGQVIVGTEAVDAEKRFPNLLPHNAVNKLEADIHSRYMGVKFLSRATDPTFVKAADVENTVNEVSRPSITAGVQNTALRIADAASNTVLGHLSLGQHDGSQSIHSNGVDFWAAPMYGNLYTSGMNVAGSSVRGQFGGLALGVDVEAGQFAGGKFRLGAAINGGGGQSETKGSVTSTQNDYDFGGLNLYAGWNKGALNVIGSLGYAFGNHEVEMGLPSSMDLGTAKADIDTTAFCADLRAEYQLKTEWLDILPHAGVRYTALKTDSHDLKVGGAVLNSTEADTQHIVQFPVGVTLSKDFAFADWNVKPSADISFIPAAGDKDMNSTLRFSGINAVDSFDSRVMDSSSWTATLGVQAEKGNFSLGLNYGVQASSHETDQNVQIKLGWKF